MNEVLDRTFWGTAKVGNHVSTPCRGLNLCKLGAGIFEKIDFFIEGWFLVYESVRIVSNMTENSGEKYFEP